MAKPPVSLTITPVLPKGNGVTFGLIGPGSFGPVSAGAAGGLQVIDRALQKAATHWVDSSPMQYDLSLLLDGGAGQASIEPQCARVFNWQYPAFGAQTPPVLMLRGPVSAQAAGLFWQMETVKFDEDEVIRDANGARTQQFITMTLWEYVPTTASVLTNLSPAQAAQYALTAKGTSASRRSYIARQGDTLSKIAARQLGDQSLWRSIASINGIRDPSSLKVGQRIVLPA